MPLQSMPLQTAPARHCRRALELVLSWGSKPHLLRDMWDQETPGGKLFAAALAEDNSEFRVTAEIIDDLFAATISTMATRAVTESLAEANDEQLVKAAAQKAFDLAIELKERRAQRAQGTTRRTLPQVNSRVTWSTDGIGNDEL